MRKEKIYYVYINTNKTNKILYIGVTHNLLYRNDQHKNKISNNSFTAKYNVNKLVYYEISKYIHNAITREK